MNLFMSSIAFNIPFQFYSKDSFMLVACFIVFIVFGVLLLKDLRKKGKQIKRYKVKIEEKKVLESIAQVTITHKNSIMRLNRDLLDSQDCWGNLKELKNVHIARLVLVELMLTTDDSALLTMYDSMYTQLEIKLQELWKFPLNVKYYRFWDRPKCKCPSMDNDDRYPTGCYIINEECPLHGHCSIKLVKKKTKIVKKRKTRRNRK